MHVLWENSTDIFNVFVRTQPHYVRDSKTESAGWIRFCKDMVKLGNLKKRDKLNDLRLDFGAMLKQILKKQDDVHWIAQAQDQGQALENTAMKTQGFFFSPDE
jgi:signal transduction histidine kinase